MYHKIKGIFLSIFKQNNFKEAENEIESACQLRESVLANDLEAVNRAINDHANVNMVLVNQSTALHLAVSHGYDDIVRALIHAPDVNLNSRDEDGNTPLNVAVMSNRERSAQLLVNAGADINILYDTHQSTMLHIAAHCGYNDIVRALIKRPDVNLNVRNKDGNTPLHSAAWSGREQSARLLIDAGADINISDNQQWTALHLAASNGHSSIVGELIKAPHRNLNVRNENGDTPLNVAADNGRAASARLLIDAGADINISDNKQRTALHMAADLGYDDILRTLIDAPDVNLNLRTETGHTPLHAAANNGRAASARLLIDAGANINISDKYQQTALHLAAYFGYDDIVDALIKRPDVNLNVRNKDGNTPLHIAADNGRAASARLLIDAGADINISDHKQRTALHMAADLGDDDIVDALIKRPDVNLNVRNENGYTPLHIAAGRGREQSARLLIDAGADINIPDHKQRTALHMAADWGYDDIVDALIKRPDVNINSRDGDGLTSLHIAADNGRAASARLLIDAGADINISDHKQRTALHMAADLGYDDIVDALIKRPDVNINPRYEDGNTPLHIAVDNRRTESARLLIDAGADINISNNSQWTALHMAADLGDDDIVDALIKRPDVNINSRDGDGNTPLHSAAWSGREQSARLLIDAGADINISNHKQRTALHLAASNGHSSIVGELIKVPHLNLNVRNENGQTPLHVAVINGMVASARLLIDAGADINIPDKYQQTALHMAADLGYDDIVDALIKRPDVNLNVRNEDGNTPLDVAVMSGMEQCAQLLIDAGADINRSDNQ